MKSCPVGRSFFDTMRVDLLDLEFTTYTYARQESPTTLDTVITASWRPFASSSGKAPQLALGSDNEFSAAKSRPRRHCYYYLNGAYHFLSECVRACLIDKPGFAPGSRWQQTRDALMPSTPHRTTDRLDGDDDYLLNGSKCDGATSTGASQEIARTTCGPGYTNREPRIHGSLHLKRGRISVEALADWGSDKDIMSSEYCLRHRLRVDQKGATSLQLANGSKVSTLGTAKELFSFDQEGQVHQIVFHILEHATHDVILGQRFLQQTRTFSHFSQRIRHVARDAASMPKICFLGGPQIISGSINGKHARACVDTGSDVTVVSAKYASLWALDIDRSPRAQHDLELADRTVITTTGMVCNLKWRYDDGSQVHIIDAYVLDNLPVDVLLGYNLIYKTQAFSSYFACFADLEGIDLDDDVTVPIAFAIKLLGHRSFIEAIKQTLLGRPEPPNPRQHEVEWESERIAQLERLRDGLASLEANVALTPDRRKEEIETLEAQWKAFMKTKPGPRAIVGAGSSAV